MPTQDEAKHFRNPIPTTDIVIEYGNRDKKGIVLITRRNPPYGIALPGGLAEWGISLEDNAMKEAREETGLEVILDGTGDWTVPGEYQETDVSRTVCNILLGYRI